MNNNFQLPSGSSLFNIKNMYNSFIEGISNSGYENLVVNPTMTKKFYVSGVEEVAGFNHNPAFPATDKNNPFSLQTSNYYEQGLFKLESNNLYSVVIDCENDQEFELRALSTLSSEVFDLDGNMDASLVVSVVSDDFGNPTRHQAYFTFRTGNVDVNSPPIIQIFATNDVNIRVYNLSTVKGTFAMNATDSTCFFTDYVRFNTEVNGGITEGFYEVSVDGINYNRIFTSSTQDIAELSLILVNNVGFNSRFIRKDIPDSTNNLLTFNAGLLCNDDLIVSTSSSLLLNGNQLTVNNSQQTGTPSLTFNLTVRRGDSPSAGIRYNEDIDYWQYSNDGLAWKTFDSLGGAGTTGGQIYLTDVDPLLVDPGLSNGSVWRDNSVTPNAWSMLISGSWVDLHASATESGLMSNADKVKLDAATTAATADTLVMRDASAEVTANMFHSVSSKRFKKDISSITNSLEIVKQLEGVNFKWVKNNKYDIGLIAEEVEKVLPSIVKKDQKGVIQGLAYDHIVAVLIEAIKEQQKQIETLYEKVG